MDDYYAILKVPRNASQAEILRAYREAARRCHPDLHPEDPRAVQRFYRVQRAFEVLSDPHRRLDYHRSTVSFDPARRGRFRASYWGSEDRAFRSMTKYVAAEVAEPALGLSVTVAVGISLQYLAFFGNLLSGPTAAGPRVARMLGLSGGGLGMLLGGCSCIVGIAVILGAIQMRHLESYRLAVTASILATLSCLSWWFLLAVPFGIWSLVVLRRVEVRDSFFS